MRFYLKLIFILSLTLFAGCTPQDVTKNSENSNDRTVEKQAPKHVSKEVKAEAIYLGNEAVLVSEGDTKILFDPFFHNSYNNYQLVPNSIRDALFTGKKPYNNIDAIFISHAHGDHFDADDVHKFLNAYPNTYLIAPTQAIDQIKSHAGDDWSSDKLISIALEYQDPPVSMDLGKFKFDTVRIPHAGWPQRADVSNLVSRVTINNSITVVHMGDADPNDEHFKPLMQHWEKQATDTAFPPYWFFASEEGNLILNERIKANENIGVHVPVKVPDGLKQSRFKYFSKPGEVYNFEQ